MTSYTSWSPGRKPAESSQEKHLSGMLTPLAHESIVNMIHQLPLFSHSSWLSFDSKILSFCGQPQAAQKLQGQMKKLPEFTNMW